MKALAIGFAMLSLFVGVISLSVKFIAWVNANEYGGYVLIAMVILIVSWLCGKAILDIMEKERW